MQDKGQQDGGEGEGGEQGYDGRGGGCVSGPRGEEERDEESEERQAGVLP